jgi:hypothetical protein
MYHIDGSDYCEPCLLAEGYEIAKAVRIAKPLAMAAAAGFAGSEEGRALVDAAIKHIEASPAKSTKGLAETRRGSSRPSSPSATQEEAMDKEKKRCAECGKEYVPLRRDSTMCSKICRQRAFYRKTHPNAKPNLNARNADGQSRAGGGDVKRKLQRKTAKPAAKPSKTVTPEESGSAASLLFTEAQLVRMFTTLPLEDKVVCIQGYLDRAQA